MLSQSLISLGKPYCYIRLLDFGSRIHPSIHGQLCSITADSQNTSKISWLLVLPNALKCRFYHISILKIFLKVTPSGPHCSEGIEEDDGKKREVLQVRGGDQRPASCCRASYLFLFVSATTLEFLHCSLWLVWLFFCHTFLFLLLWNSIRSCEFISNFNVNSLVCKAVLSILLHKATRANSLKSKVLPEPHVYRTSAKLQYNIMNTGLAHCAACLFTAQHLPKEGWPGWVDVGGWL